MYGKKFEETKENQPNEPPKRVMFAVLTKMEENKFTSELIEVFKQNSEKYKLQIAKIYYEIPLYRRKEYSYLDDLIKNIFLDCEQVVFSAYLLENSQELSKGIPDQKIFQEFLDFLKCTQRDIAYSLFISESYETTKELCEKHYQNGKRRFIWSMVEREKECPFCAFGEKNPYLKEKCPKCSSDHYVLHTDCGSTGQGWDNWFCFDCKYSYAKHFD